MTNEELERRVSQLEQELKLLRSRTGNYWNENAPQIYTPTWTGQTTNPALGDGSIIGEYFVMGKLVTVHVLLTIGSTTTLGTGYWLFGLPPGYPVKNNGRTYMGITQCRDAGTNSYPRMAQAAYSLGATVVRNFVQLDSATNVSSLDATTPFGWGNADSITFQITYETE